MAAPAQGNLFDETPALVAAPVSAAAPAPPAPPEKRLMLIDASGFVFRAYHALPALTTSKGVVTHAVLGFARMLLKLMREKDPPYIALCFDKDSRKGRLAIDPTYKANRTETPADLVSQFSLIRKVADVLNLPILEFEGWEADDVAATVVQKARAQGFHTLIVTSDKDFLQLLADDVSLYDPAKDKAIGEADALAKYGVKPSQMADYLALVGDAIDNVAKVPGIGPKTASELLAQFASVDDLLARVDCVVKPKVREALKANEETLRRALKLVTFRSDLPLEFELDALKRQDVKHAEARALFTELEFFRLLQEMPQAKVAKAEVQTGLVRVADEAGVSALLAVLLNETSVGLAPAFEGAPHSHSPKGLGVSVGKGTAYFVDFTAIDKAQQSRLVGALTRPGLKAVASDGKALMHVYLAEGVADPQVHTDVELLSYLLNPSRKAHVLADLARERLGLELPTLQSVGGSPNSTVGDVSADDWVRIFGLAADTTLRLTEDLWKEIELAGLGSLARDLELPLVPALARMERLGVMVDRQVLGDVSMTVDQQCTELLAKVYALAGREFNVGSPPQLAQVLFTDLKLPVLKKGKTGPSTDHEVLEKLAQSHPLPGAIIEYRNVAKLKSTYLDTLPVQLGEDGRIRTTFQQAAAATGRLSSTDPNLQNIPIRTEMGRQIRKAFVAQPGWKLVSADYSQIELRILAHIADDAGLIAAFAEDADVHARTSAEVFGVPLAEVTAEQRRVAKMVNYGIAYGLSPHGLSTRLNIPIEEAAAVIARYFERYPGIDRYLRETVESARRKGYVESLFGRRRYMPDLVSKNRNIAMAAERAAINMPIQATAADLVKRAMLLLERELTAKKMQSRMLLQVHDELLIEAPFAEAEEAAGMAKRVMSAAGQLKVPLVVDVGVGHSWDDAH
ncbi:MAG: DNA polymerase I [Myxococcaceae bacterium]|nr:DNA polymerase I [Myxococcaceae bacterium]